MGTHNQIYDEIIIPEDIRRVVCKNKWKAVVKLGLLLILFAIIAFTVGLSLFRHIPLSSKIIALICWMLIPFVYTCIPFKLFKKPFCGVIQKIQISDDIVTNFHWKTFYQFRSTMKNTIIIFVKTENRKLIRIPALIGSVKNGDWVDFFEIGDKVLCIPYSNFVQRFPVKRDKRINCVVCGVLQNQEKNNCVLCGHSLNLIKKGE